MNIPNAYTVIDGLFSKSRLPYFTGRFTLLKSDPILVLDHLS
ncbi:hypothetical protein [Rhizobium sp. 42MFCr.1]|nr:hypothetical protein [Rhizobium sp. 42MFCr.1]